MELIFNILFRYDRFDDHKKHHLIVLTLIRCKCEGVYHLPIRMEFGFDFWGSSMIRLMKTTELDRVPKGWS